MNASSMPGTRHSGSRERLEVGFSKRQDQGTRGADRDEGLGSVHLFHYRPDRRPSFGAWIPRC